MADSYATRSPIEVKDVVKATTRPRKCLSLLGLREPSFFNPFSKDLMLLYLGTVSSMVRTFYSLVLKAKISRFRLLDIIKYKFKVNQIEDLGELALLRPTVGRTINLVMRNFFTISRTYLPTNSEMNYI
jgi:hypothetical protein